MNARRFVVPASIVVLALISCAASAPPLLRSGPDPADPGAAEAPMAGPSAALSAEAHAPLSLPDAGGREATMGGDAEDAGMQMQMPMHHHGGSSDGGSP